MDETDRLIERYHRRVNRKIFIWNYFKRLIFLYTINVLGYFYLHFIILAHFDEAEIDFNSDDLIFFLTLPILCFFPVNHILSKDDYKHYLTYLLGYFNGINFSLLSSLSNLDDFALNTYKFKKEDQIHIAVLVLLIILGVYSIGYTLYVTKKKKLVSFLIFTPMIITTIYCLVKESQGYVTHIHHYFIGLFLILISYHPRYITLIINSVSFGVYLEGVVQWGYAPLIYKQ